MRRKPNEKMMTEAALWFLTALMLVMTIAGYLLAGGQSHGQRPSRTIITADQGTPPKNQRRVFRVTAYCPCEKCCGKFADGITASGHRIQPGDRFCAAPATIPFGTLLDIPGYGKAVPVLDRGGAIVAKGSTLRREGRTFITDYDRLDVFFPTHQEALQWGVQILTITHSQEKQ